MFEKIKIIRQIKRLRKKPMDKEFLDMLKSRFELYIDANPAEENVKIKWTFTGLTKLRAIQISLAAFILLILTSAGLAFASQKSLPGDTLFGVKIAVEKARMSVAFSPESKAQLQMRFSAKRVEEIKEILEKKDVESKNLDMALDKLGEHVKEAVDILEKQKKEGRGNNELSKKINSAFEASQAELKETFQSHEGKIKNQEEEIMLKISQSNEAGNSSSSPDLLMQLERVKIEQEKIGKEREKAMRALEQERKRIEKKP